MGGGVEMKNLIVLWILYFSFVYTILAFTFWDLSVMQHLGNMAPNDGAAIGFIFSGLLVFLSGICCVEGTHK